MNCQFGHIVTALAVVQPSALPPHQRLPPHQVPQFRWPIADGRLFKTMPSLVIHQWHPLQRQMEMANRLNGPPEVINNFQTPEAKSRQQLGEVVNLAARHPHGLAECECGNYNISF
jgi:hypothetical protein